MREQIIASKQFQTELREKNLTRQLEAWPFWVEAVYKINSIFLKKTDAKTIRCLIHKMVVSSKVLLYQPIQFIHKLCWSTLRQKNKNIPELQAVQSKIFI